jgi:hypothetical protein
MESYYWYVFPSLVILLGIYCTSEESELTLHQYEAPAEYAINSLRAEEALALQNIDFSQPLLITGLQWAAHNLLSVESEARKHLEGFMTTFSGSPLYKAPGRAQLRIKSPELAGLIVEGFKSAFSASVLSQLKFAPDLAEGNVAIPTMSPGFFGLSKDRSLHIGFESSSAPGIRIVARGAARSMVLVPFTVAGMAARNANSVLDPSVLSKPVSSRATFEWLRKVSCDDFKEAVTKANKKNDGGCFCFCTVGPGDALYVPGGYIVMEQLKGFVDVAGVRMGVLTDATYSIRQLRACYADAMSNGRTDAVMQELITLMETPSIPPALEQPAGGTITPQAGQEKNAEAEGAEGDEKKTAEPDAAIDAVLLLLFYILCVCVCVCLCVCVCVCV